MGTELRRLKYRLEREVACVTMVQIDQRHPLCLFGKLLCNRHRGQVGKQRYGPLK
jgi:hypothetical protein